MDELRFESGEVGGPEICMSLRHLGASPRTSDETLTSTKEQVTTGRSVGLRRHGPLLERHLSHPRLRLDSDFPVSNDKGESMSTPRTTHLTLASAVAVLEAGVHEQANVADTGAITRLLESNAQIRDQLSQTEAATLWTAERLLATYNKRTGAPCR